MIYLFALFYHNAFCQSPGGQGCGGVGHFLPVQRDATLLDQTARFPLAGGQAAGHKGIQNAERTGLQIACFQNSGGHILGIGHAAKPAGGTAAGKTGTAQTGQFDAAGDELLNYWFSGFTPAQTPKYTITVLQDGVLEPETSSAALFAKIAEGLQVIEQPASD